MKTCGVVLLLVLRLLAAASEAAEARAVAPAPAKPEEKVSAKADEKASAKPDEKASAKSSDGGGAAAKKTVVKPPPAKGSKIKPDDNFCFQCHSNQDPNDPKTARLCIAEKTLQQDIHWQKGVSCHDCHGGNYKTAEFNEAHAAEDGFRALRPDPARPPAESQAAIHAVCSQCHSHQSLELVKGRHAKGGPKNDRGEGTLMACEKCHGKVSHQLLAAHDPRSPVFLDNQVETCGACHQRYLATYKESVHGHGLYKSGLVVTASCASCHGAHGVYQPADNRSTLNSANVATTCGKCHRFIAEILEKSVHGRGRGLGAAADREAPGGKTRQHPSCTDCHRGHDIVLPESARFRLQLPNRCGNCHAKLSNRYAMSIHGELTELGYAPAAQCSDCHGGHDIGPVSEAGSRLSPERRAETCMQCHPHARGSFVDFDPHADHTDPHGSPLLYWCYRGFMTLLVSVFAFFGSHSVLWLVRGMVDVFKHGRPQSLTPGATAYVRFASPHRLAHAVLLVSFLGLAATGLPLKYSEHDWAKRLALSLGGFASTSLWHRFFALGTFACFFVYVLAMVRLVRTSRRRGESWRGALFGPDSLVPNWRDAKDFVRMMRWFVGLGPRPSFERWAYWEKFDFWGASADIVIIGVTGLILWFPNLFCSFLPGISLNIAKVIHSTQALLATGFVFAVHFFHTHLRIEKFPADMSVLTGMVSEDELEEERKDYLERIRRTGAFESLRTQVPSRKRLWIMRLWGFVALAAGLALLAGILVGAMGG